MALNLVANFWPALVAAIVSMVIGMLWYGPLFGKTWMSLMGFKKKDMKKEGMGKIYFYGFVASLITAYVLAMFVAGMTVSGALATAFWIWLGFFAAVMAGSVLWEMKPSSLYFLNIAYWLVSLEVMAWILSVML